MTSAHSLTLAELRERYPKWGVVERSDDSDEYNRQRYFARLGWNRLFFTIVPMIGIATICAVLAYHFDAGQDEGFSKFYLVRNVTALAWGIWAIGNIIYGWIDGYCSVPGAPDVYKFTKYDPVEWWLPVPIVCGLFISLFIVVFVLLYLAPSTWGGGGMYSISFSDGELVASIKVFVIMSMDIIGMTIFVAAEMALLRFFLKRIRNKLPEKK